MAVIRRSWEKPEGQQEFVKKCVVEKNLHPEDIVPLFEKKFGFPRGRPSIERALCKMNISYRGTMPKREQILERKRKEQTLTKVGTKKKIKEDVRLLQLQQRLRVVTAKYDALVGEAGLGNRLVKVLKEEAKVLPRAKLAWRAPVHKITKEVAVLLLGDTHIWEVVDRDAVCDFGEYNFEIFVKRMKFLFESIKSITVKKLKGYQIKKLVIFGLGDMVSGRIHEELIETGESIISQVLNGAYVVAQFVLELRQLFPKIEIVGVLGNHGRLVKRKQFKRRYENWDFIFYQFLGVFLASNPDIKCKFPKSFFIIEKIYDWNFLVLHGDTIKSWMRIPWYGIERAMWRLGDLLSGKGINIHYKVVGHFHNTGELDRAPGELIMNGSVMGGSEYSLMTMFAFDRPTQLFFGVHEEIGVTWRYPLRLDLKEADEVKPYSYTQQFDAAKYMKELLKEKKSG